MNKLLVGILLIGLTFFTSTAVYAQSATATATWNAVTTSVNGTAMTGVTYNMYRSPNSDGSAATKLNSTPIASTTYVDSTISSSSTYYFQVSGVSVDGVEGAKSSIVRFNYSDRVPSAPGSLVIK